MQKNSDHRLLKQHIADTIGDDPTAWDMPGDGWAGEIEAAFLDAVLSVQAVYGNSPDTGVRLRVKKWRSYRQGSQLDDLHELAAWASASKAKQLAVIIDNRQTLSGRGKGRPLKTLAVAQAAAAFVAQGISSAQQIKGSPRERGIWRSVDGLGPVTWHYVLMLLGKPDVKADTMISRYVKNALGRSLNSESTRKLVVAAAEDYSVEATDLDYAIWSWQRQLKRG